MNKWMNNKKISRFIHPSFCLATSTGCVPASLARSFFSLLARSLARSRRWCFCRDRFLCVHPDRVMAGCSNNPRSGSISSGTHDSLNWSPAPRIVCKSPHPPRISVFFFSFFFFFSPPDLSKDYFFDQSILLRLYFRCCMPLLYVLCCERCVILAMWFM